MLEKVKMALRINSNKLDTEISDLIEACKVDLSIGGVKVINLEDPLIQRAIIIYCKTHFGLGNKDSEKYQLSYNMLKQSLALCGDYNTEVTV